MDRQVKKGTEISELHESILYQILKFLPFEDAVRTSVLSKKWNSILKCFPVMKFKLPDFMNGMHVRSAEFRERNRHFLHFVHTTLQNKLSMEKIGFHVSDIDDDSLLLVNTWLPLTLHSGVADLRFKAKDDYYPLPETTFSVNSGSSKFLNLRKLKLSLVVLSETTVRDIIRHCPNLSDLSLLEIDGLEALTIIEPVKLVSLTIRVPDSGTGFRSTVVNTLSLKHFSLVFIGDLTPGGMIDLTSCSNLTELELFNTTFTDASFNLHVSKLPLLEVLDVTSCNDLRRIKISLRRLKHLKLRCCFALEAIEIDAPMLSKFDFSPFGHLVELVLRDVIPGSMYLIYSEYSEDARLDSAWFFKIREYLSVPFKGIIFSFYTHDDESTFCPDELSFDHDDLREALIPPLVEVDCLDLTYLIVPDSSHWETLLDGLLWSCHPKMIRMNMKSYYPDAEKYIKIKVLCRMLNESGCRLCCNLPCCKCWRYRLKAVKIESIKGIQIRDLNFGSVGDNYLSNPEDNEVRFIIDWDHSV